MKNCQWDNSKTNYNAPNEVAYNTKVLKSSVCDYNDAYILVRGDMTVTAAPEIQVLFKNYAPITKCITSWCNNNRRCWRFRFSHGNVQSNRI